MYKTVTDVIGNTPLVSVDLCPKGTLLAKLEFLNPGGSLKDRTAIHLIQEAEKQGLLKPGGTIIDASSGNQGIACAMIGALKGYNVIMCVAEKISKEKLAAIQAYGADVRIFPVTNFLEDPQSYHSQAVKLHKEIPNSFMPNQYFNPSNSEAHYKTLGPELWQQTDGKITHLFAAAGTGGTISGAGRYLTEKNPDIKILAMDSNNSYKATGGNPKPYQIEGMGLDFDSPVFDESMVDDIILVSDDDALPMLKTLAREHGILAGPSSGAVAWAAQDYAQKNFTDTDLGVMVFGDSGRAYLTKNFY